ncbi:LCP family protein [Streptomyces fuscigenes]|uniref:LCP family protein n=1 Tax=Streptomyces fuscigenes TaxID=1528880 RepID=UPI001F3A6629|nr:LCP family protein [Streptomyces fuscigenes]MCF3960642.1 LCP family protein [Streptomyces fuscigenes]
MPAGRKVRWGTRLATTLSVLVLGAGGIGHAVVTSVDNGIGRVDPFKDMKNRPAPGHGMNLLLVGTDDRSTVSPAQKQRYRLGGAPCHCTDTIMLVHLSEGGKRASVVSLPRDSYTRLPSRPGRSGAAAGTHPAKLNAAYAEGGPTLTVRTVESMTGVKVDHYLEVDFTSFMKTVDALGGVQICTPRRLKDTNTGLDLAPGTHRLNGGEALQYVRSRHIDGDGSADLGRMQRQQRFVAALIARATDSGVLLNPVRFQGVVSAALDSVRADAGFGPEQLLALGRAMRGFSPSSSEFASVPLAAKGVDLKEVGSAVRWDPARAKQLFAKVRADRPLAPPRAPAAPARQRGKIVDVAPGGIRVQVYNGTATDGLGKRVDDALKATGFDTTRRPATKPALKAAETVVEYDPRWDRSARSLAAALPGSRLRAVKGLGATLRVVAGSKYAGVAPVRAEEAPKGAFGTIRGDAVVCP